MAESERVRELRLTKEAAWKAREDAREARDKFVKGTSAWQAFQTVYLEKNRLWKSADAAWSRRPR